MQGFNRTLLTGVLVLLASLTAWSGEPKVLVRSSAGDMVVELYEEAAPATVANFLRYVDGGHYQNSSFYRVVRSDNQRHQPVKIQIIQGGKGLAESEPQYPPVAHEDTRSTGLRHLSGTLSMSRLEPGSASSEFFICLGDQPELDYGGERYPDGQGFAAFGRVVSGMDVVGEIQRGATEQGDSGYAQGQMLLEPVLIHDITRLQD